MTRSLRSLSQRTYPVQTVVQFSRVRCNRLCHFSEKIALSHISKRYENAPKSRFTRLWTRSETGISDYDKLSKEQFVSLIETPKLSKYLKAPSTGEGRQNRKCRTASEKETQIRKPRHLLNAGVGVLLPYNALEFLA